MSLSLTAKKVPERNSWGGTTFAKQLYGSAISSELGVSDGKCNKLTITFTNHLHLRQHSL